MAKGLTITVSVLLAVGLMFYVLISNSSRSTHMHFSTQGGVLRGVVYYSAKSPEQAIEHTCDDKFVDMPIHLYEAHLKLWRENYGEEGDESHGSRRLRVL